MSKVSRSVLKSLVKECLVEILAEGLVNTNDQIQESKKVAAKRVPKRTSQKRKKPTTKKDVIPETIRGMTDDPLMQSIFADTAKTTLQEQSSAERNPRHISNNGISEQIDNNDLGDIFGEASDNWATLAFSEKKLPGQHK